MFSGLIEAAKALMGAAGTLQRLGDERRAKLASYFDAIAAALAGIVERRRRGEKARDLCSELRVYADGISEVAGTTLSESEVNRLVVELNRAQHSRTMMFIAQMPDDQFYEIYAGHIEEAAGSFRGLANTLRAK
jgi:hypothetical protein